MLFLLAWSVLVVGVAHVRAVLVKQQMLYKHNRKQKKIRMCMTTNKGSGILWYLVLSSAISLISSQNAQPTAGVQIQMKMAVDDAALELSTIHQDAIALFFATQTEESCKPLSCPLTPANDIIFEPIANGVLINVTTNTYIFDIGMNIKLPDNSRALSVKTSSNNDGKSYGLSKVKLNSNLLLQPSLGLNITTYDVVYTRDAARPLVCGDSMVTGDEVCDDGNEINGDGCSSTCTLETGYTCYSAMREDVATRGKMTEWVTNTSTGIKTLVVSSVDEFCTSDDIRIQDANVWDPDYWWTQAYSSGSIPRVSLAPGGFYCKDFCTDTFSPAKFYEFRESCIPTGKDECSRGESTCDVNAYCEEPVDQVGFECECNEKYFVSKIDGAVCATSGVEVEFQMGGMILGSGSSGPDCSCVPKPSGCDAVPTSTVYHADVMPDSLAPTGPNDSVLRPAAVLWKYCTGIIANEHIYLIPSNANAVGKYNPKTDTFSTIDMSAYRDYLLPDGSVAREPAGDSMSMGYALQTQYETNPGVDDQMAWSNFDYNKYSTALLVDGIIYCFPKNAASIGMIDTTTDTFSTVLGLFGNTVPSNILSAVLNGGVIYLFDIRLSTFDPATKEISNYIHLGMGDVLHAISGPNGKIYLTPYTIVLDEAEGSYSVAPMKIPTRIFHTIDNSITRINTLGVKSGISTQSYGNGVLHPNGKIYLAPLFAATIGVIDTLTDTFSTVDITSIFPCGATDETCWLAPHNYFKFFTAVLGNEGKVYFLPLYAPRMMVYDPDTGVFELILDTHPTPPVWGSVVLPDPMFQLPAAPWNEGVMFEQKMYLIPFNAAGITVIDFGCCESCLPPGNIETDRANMVDARLKFIDELFAQQYLNEQSSPALLIEGVKQYPIDLVTPLIEDASSPLFMRSLWRIVLRAPDVHLNLAKIAQSTIFDDTATWARVFDDSDKYLINQVGQCANDRARSCDAGNPSCLNGATCITDRADFTVNKLDAGGVTAPLQVESSGMEVLSVDYDITQSAFSVRMRYNDEIPGVIDAVFLSHMGVDQNPLRLPTFRSDEFPCLPLGTKQFQNQRDNSGICQF